MTHDLTTEEGIAALEAICEAATPGPWVDLTDSLDAIYAVEPYGQICRDPDMDDRPEDRAFIVAARTALPEALAEIRALRQEVGELTDFDAANDEEEERIEKLTHEELDAELRAEGINPDGLAERVSFNVCATLGARLRAAKEENVRLQSFIADLESTIDDYHADSVGGP